MPAYFDTVERCYRAENDAGQIVGYYPSEAAAVAALQPAAQGDDSDFRAMLRLIDEIADKLADETEEAPRLSDGTFYTPAYDGDGGFIGYEVDTATFGITADDDGHVSFQVFDPHATNDLYDDESFDLTPALWRNLKALVLSGIIDELIEVAVSKPLPDRAPRRARPAQVRPSK